MVDHHRWLPVDAVLLDTVGHFAVAWDDSEQTKEEVVVEGERRVYHEAGLKGQCGICRGEDIHVEHGRTGYHSMEAARPYLEALQQTNGFARQLFGDSSFDPAELPKHLNGP